MAQVNSTNHLVPNITEKSKAVPKETIYDVCRRQIKDQPDFVVMKVKSDSELDHYDKSITFIDHYKLIMKAAKSMVKIGLKPRKSVCLMGFNAPEWFTADMATTFVGAYSVGMYNTNSAEECDYVMAHSECQILIVQNRVYLDNLRSILSYHTDQLLGVVLYSVVDGEKDTCLEMIEDKIPVYSWSQFMDIGADVPDDKVEDIASKLSPDDGCFLVYTSGTTGHSKGALVTHDNVIYQCWLILNSFGYQKYSNRSVSYLPLSHVLGKYELIFSWYVGTTIYFAEPDAMKGSLGKTLREVKPTTFYGVPRVYEKIQESLITGAIERRKIQSYFKNVCQDFLVSYAKKSGLRNSKRKQAGKSTDWSYSFANMILFRRIKAILGLSKATRILSAGAPLSEASAKFFMSLDIQIMSVYGLTEGGICIFATQDYNIPGSIGTVPEGTDIKLNNVNAEGEGEICIKSRSTFKGYWKDEKKTAEVLDKDGWVHTGDLAEIKMVPVKVKGNKATKKEIPFFFITGRIKELIITSGGENVAPVPLEERIKEQLPYISNVLLVGNNRKFIACLLTLKVSIDSNTLIPSNKLSTQSSVMLSKIAGQSVTTCEDIIEMVENESDNRIKDNIARAISITNDTAISNAAKVKKWKILTKDFSIPGGELGSTFKLKRFFIYEKYKKEIEAFYL